MKQIANSWKRTCTPLVVLALVIAACGGDSGASTTGTTGDATTTAPTTTTTTSAQETTTSAATEPAVEGELTFWLTPDVETIGAWWNSFIETFEGQNPGATVDFLPLPTDQQETRPAAAFAAGTEPDVFQRVAGELLNRYVREGKIAPLNDLVDLEGVNPGTLSLFTGPDGNVYGIPTHQFLLLMWYNQDKFEELSLEVPKTWDEMLAACGTLNDAGIIPIALGNSGQDQFTTTFWYSALLYQLAGATASMDATYGANGVSWTDPVFVEAAARLKELVDAECFAPGFAGLNYSQMGSLFIREEAAMVFNGTWFGAEILAGEAAFDVGVFAPADVPGAVNSMASMGGLLGGATGLAATQKGVEAHPELVAAFLNAVVADIDKYANDNAQLSASAAPERTGDPLQDQLLDVAAATGEVAPVTDFVPSALQEALGSNVQALTIGALSPEEFAQAMAEASELERPNLPDLG